ncbi:MAG: 3-phosphoshikimate 1-carboxyvinyltransferase [Bacteroidales bacterium]|nr:3-phosphoshikimate 1-carboxyvinyltransferase [Bacteroidales bacterium]MCF8405287.1 3-phosphoshikimate 1-carboxyvinyltransferase [Bacteroidales bacterium]
MNVVRLKKKDRTVNGSIHIPSSKSLSNRALILEYLSSGQSNLVNLSEAEDTILMKKLLQIIKDNNGKEHTQLNCQNAGTVIRFLTALLAITPGHWILTGDIRMQHRPIGNLVKALKELGADIQFPEKKGFPPLEIHGKKLRGGSVSLDGSISSQFITALLLIAPMLEGGLKIKLTSKINSKPYIHMSLGVLKEFSVTASFINSQIQVKQKNLIPTTYKIETDWSSAAFWYQMVAFAEDAKILIPGLKKESLQGDVVLHKIYNFLGVKTEFVPSGIVLTKSGNRTEEFNYDFSQCPDLAQAVIATCVGLNISGKFTGLESLRIKETDRIEAMTRELQTLGYDITAGKSTIEIRKLIHQPFQKPGQKTNIINTYNDHRMAMGFAPFVLLYDEVFIQDPEVVSKSYPGFWQEIQKTGISLKYNS